MASREHVARVSLFGLGAGALLGASTLAMTGTAAAATCGSTAVKGLSLTRAAAKSASGALRAPTGPLAFTGAAGVIAGLLVGTLLLVAGISVVLLSRGRGRWRAPAWLLMIVCGLGVIALVGSHAASAAPALATASCVPSPVQAGTGQLPVPIAVSGTTLTGTTGSAPTNPGTTGSAGGIPVSGTGSSEPPAALPDASAPLELVLVGATAGVSALVIRRRRNAC